MTKQALTRADFVVSDTSGIPFKLLTQHVPAILATGPHKSRSEQYGFTNSVRILRALYDLDYIPVYGAQALPKDKGKLGHTKLTVRLRHRSALTEHDTSTLPRYQLNRLDDVTTYEIVYVDSHDGSTLAALYGGWFRQVCGNGMISGDIRDMFSIKHLGEIEASVIVGIRKLLQGSERAGHEIEAMKRLVLSLDEQRAFAQFAIDLRFGKSKSETRMLFNEQDYLARLRPQDKQDNLWVLLNVLQEKLIRGVSKQVRWEKKTVRAVGSVDAQVDMNRALWMQAVDILASHGGVQFVDRQGAGTR